MAGHAGMPEERHDPVAMIRQMRKPWLWTNSIVIALGLWLMVAPSVLGSQGATADSDHLVGALIVTVAGIATAEVIRAGRLLNTLLGGWLIMAPWLLVGAAPAARWNDVIVGSAVLLLSLPLGTVREQYGRWDRYVVWPSSTARGAAVQRRRGRAV
jgi:hypothetical protein